MFANVQLVKRDEDQICDHSLSLIPVPGLTPISILYHDIYV